MLNYNELMNGNKSIETKHFTDGLQKLDSDSIVKCGKPLHIIEVNYWTYNDKECVSVKFREYEGYYYNAGTKLKEFIDKVKQALDDDVDNVNIEFRNNPPTMKFSKVKTKSGFWCVVPELVDEQIERVLF